MINQTNVSADKVRTEVLSSIQPNLLNKVEKKSTFNNSLQDLALTLLTSHSVSENSQNNTNLASKTIFKVRSIITAYFPWVKTKNS